MHIFVSHSRVNSSVAFRLCDELRKNDVETWLDVRDIEVGEEWNQAVDEAIRSAAGFVFVIGPPGPGDRWQTFEWQQIVMDEYYLDPSKPLIPVLIGDPQIPGFLSTRQFLILGDAPDSIQEVARGIVNAIANPASSVDESKVELGREARQRALKSFQDYSRTLAEEEIKRSGTRAAE